MTTTAKYSSRILTTTMAGVLMSGIMAFSIRAQSAPALDKSRTTPSRDTDASQSKSDYHPAAGQSVSDSLPKPTVSSDFAAEFAAIQREMDDIQLAIERHARQNLGAGWYGPKEFGQPLAPNSRLADSNQPVIPIFKMPKADMPPSMEAPYSFRRSWSQQSSSSWSQNGSRFQAVETIRGLIVRLTGSVEQGVLTVEKIEIATGRNGSWTSYAKPSDIPSAYQDEVEAARKLAQRQVAASPGGRLKLGDF
jgi:hypothetical protein